MGTPTVNLKCDKCGYAPNVSNHSRWVGWNCACGGTYEYPESTELPSVDTGVTKVSDITPRQMVLTSDSAARKELPICEGVLDYFPNAIAAIARLSKKGNDKHNPGQPLHWAVEKSRDHANCIPRHLIDRGAIDPDSGEFHEVSLAWRALALLEEAEVARGARRGRAAY